jgi:peptidoglycan/xylan/chitin deacetylase (PgdA/CDA1 family)
VSDLLVLCYHGVSERWPAKLSITPEKLESQLATVTRRGYRSVTFSDALASPPASKTVAITFDDGYRSVLEQALPILSRLGLVATVFVVTGYVGREEPMSWPGVDEWLETEHARELVSLSREQVSHLLEAGWEVGSHTRTHPRLTTLDDERLDEELGRAREDCERLFDRPCRSIAYPYGDLDERVVAAAGRAGYSFAGALSTRLNVPRPLEWPRIGIYHGDDDARFKVKISPAVRRLRATAAFGAADRVRQLLRKFRSA